MIIMAIHLTKKPVCKMHTSLGLIAFYPVQDYQVHGILVRPAARVWLSQSEIDRLAGRIRETVPNVTEASLTRVLGGAA